jgi:hypothetical protein
MSIPFGALRPGRNPYIPFCKGVTGTDLHRRGIFKSNVNQTWILFRQLNTEPGYDIAFCGSVCIYILNLAGIRLISTHA